MGYAKNLRQLVNLTLRIVNDYRGNYKNGKYFTVQEVITAINDALLNLALDTGALKSVSLIIPVADMQIYTLPADCLRPIQLKLDNLHGGELILPKQVSQYDYERDPISDTGAPVSFHRDNGLAWNQIGFVPTPGTAGGAAATDGGTGLMRRISDGTNDLTYDANRPLRRITGKPIEYGGDGRIIRNLAANEGSIIVHYVKNPARLGLPHEYPDSDFPTWLHKDIKFGAGEYLTRGPKIKIHAIKYALCLLKWQKIRGKMQERVQATGPLSEARPL